MTTTITVRHDGPDHSDVQIEGIGNAIPTGIKFLTSPGQEFTGYFWSGGVFVVTEVPKTSTPPQQ